MEFSYMMKENGICSSTKRPGVRPDSTNTGETIRGNIKANWTATDEAALCVVTLTPLAGTLSALIPICKTKIQDDLISM